MKNELEAGNIKTKVVRNKILVAHAPTASEIRWHQSKLIHSNSLGVIPDYKQQLLWKEKK